MKNLVKIMLLLSLSLVVMVSCRDKEAEKRIAQLESRIAELEGPAANKATNAPTNTAAVPETNVITFRRNVPLAKLGNRLLLFKLPTCTSATVFRTHCWTEIGRAHV